MSDETPLSTHRPAGSPKGGIVLIQEAFGVNDHIEDVGGRLAAEGWLCVAPHLFHRTGDPKLGYSDMSLVAPHMKALTADQVLADVDAALGVAHDASIPPERCGIVGFCMGGTIALITGAQRPLGAAVTFYGGGVVEGRFGFPPLVEEATRLKAPWLGLYGDDDQAIPVAQVEQLRIAAQASGQPTEIVRYPSAGHGFHCDRRQSFESASAADAWQRTLAWFEQYLLA